MFQCVCIVHKVSLTISSISMTPSQIDDNFCRAFVLAFVLSPAHIYHHDDFRSHRIRISHQLYSIDLLFQAELQPVFSLLHNIVAMCYLPLVSLMSEFLLDSVAAAAHNFFFHLFWIEKAKGKIRKWKWKIEGKKRISKFFYPRFFV